MNNFNFHLFDYLLIYSIDVFSIRYQQNSYFNSEMSYFDTELYAACIIYW